MPFSSELNGITAEAGFITYLTGTIDSCNAKLSGGGSAFLDRLLQLGAEFRRVLVTVDRHRMLHCDFHQLVLAVR